MLKELRNKTLDCAGSSELVIVHVYEYWVVKFAVRDERVPGSNLVTASLQLNSTKDTSHTKDEKNWTECMGERIGSLNVDTADLC